MKKTVLVLVFIFLLTTCCAFAAKYKVNSNGAVTTKSGVKVNSTNATTTPYTVYQSQNYVAQNQVNSSQVGTIELVMDFSGSMTDCIKEAKYAMSSIINQIPNSTKIGFRVFGQNNVSSSSSTNVAVPKSQQVSNVGEVKSVKKSGKKYSILTKNNSKPLIPENYLGSTSGYCSATTQVSKIAASNSSNILHGLNSTSLGGSTPLVYGLYQAVNSDFAGMATNYSKKIVLVTDGGENCGGDPCIFAKALMAQRSDVHIDVVLIGGGFSNLACLAKTTGGHTYTVKNLSNFSTVMVQSMTSIPTPVTTTKVDNQQQYEFYGEN